MQWIPNNPRMFIVALAVVYLLLLVEAKPKGCKKKCGDDSWTQSVKEAEDSVFGEESFKCHSCVNDCIHDKKVEKYGKKFDVYKAECDEREEYYKWHFGTAMVECMEEAGKKVCEPQMKFSCGYDFKNMMKTSGPEGCKWTESCKEWGFENAKFKPEDASWEPYTEYR